MLLETVSAGQVSGRPECFRIDSTGGKHGAQWHELKAKDEVCLSFLGGVLERASCGCMRRPGQTDGDEMCSRKMCSAALSHGFLCLPDSYMH